MTHILKEGMRVELTPEACLLRPEDKGKKGVLTNIHRDRSVNIQWDSDFYLDSAMYEDVQPVGAQPHYQIY